MILPYDPTQDATRVDVRARTRGLADELADGAETELPHGAQSGALPRPAAGEPVEGPGADWEPFDPGDPPPHPPLRHGRGAVVAVVASTELVGVGWAVSVTVELARAWAEERAGVVLVDTNLDRPRVHHGVGVINATGLAEVLVGTASITEATHVVVADRFFCVPAGNAPELPEDAFDPARWRRLCRAFTDAAVTLVAYVPLEAPWRDAVLETATDVIELREQHTHLPWTRPAHLPLAAVLGPMPLVRPPADPTGRETPKKTPLLGFPPLDGSDEEEDDASGVGPLAVEEASDSEPPVDEDLKGIDALREMDSGGTDASRADGPIPTEGQGPLATPAGSGEVDPSPEEGAPIDLLPVATRASIEAERRRRRIQIAGVLAVGAAAFLFALRLSTAPNTAAPAPGGSSTAGAVATNSANATDPVNESEAPPPSAITGAPPGGPAPSFSVQVAAFADPDRAEQQLARFGDVLADVPWSIVPVEVGGTVYHRVMAGLLADSAQGEALADRLAASGALAAPNAIVRATGLVYDLGMHPTLEPARAAAARLEADGIHAVVSMVTRDDGSTAFHVYAGGFSDGSEAIHLGDRLTELGLRAELTPRTGRPAS